MDPTGWFERQSRARQRRLVLVISAVCAGKYGAGRARKQSARGAERIVCRPETEAAVEVESGLCLSGRKRCSCASKNSRFRAACQVFLTDCGNAVLSCIVDFWWSISSVNSNHLFMTDTTGYTGKVSRSNTFRSVSMNPRMKLRQPTKGASDAHSSR